MSTKSDEKEVAEIELKTTSRDTQSSSSESIEKNQELPHPVFVGTKPPLQLRPPLHHSSDSKSSNGWGGDCTPDISPVFRSSESEHVHSPQGKRLSANYTPTWSQSKSTSDTPSSRIDTTESTTEHTFPSTYPHGIAESEECDTPTESTVSLTDDLGESAILEDLERKVGFGALGGGTDNLAGLAGFTTEKPNNTIGVAPNSTTERGRSASVMAAPMDLLTRIRIGRKMSQESIEYMGFDEMRQPMRSTLRYCVVNFIEGIHYLTPGFYQRLNVYMLVFVILLIAFIARDASNAIGLLRLYGCTVVLEFICSMCDRVIYYIIDVLFVSHFDVAYQLHSLNGPLGLIVAIFVMKEYWNELGLHADDVLPRFDNLLTAAAVIVICLAGKNWLIRKQYIQLLESRFTAKVENLNTMIIILSELASSRPPRSVQLQRASVLQKKTPPNVSTSGVLNATTNMKTRVRNVFADIVESTEDATESQEVITRRELFLKRRSFWQSAARLNATAGRMKVITYNGVVNIHNQGQAKEFGRKLFKHLSKGGKVVVTPELIRKLFEERRELVNRDLDCKAEHDLEMQEVATGQASKALYEHEGDAQDLWARAATMFDPFNLGRISEDFCAEAVLNIYKEQRFTAASISDFGELHQSLRIGIDIVYWIVMIFVLQGVFGFNITVYILPFITILLTFSFAIASLVGNVFLAFAFVFFMSPYDVGHKVQFGLMNVYTPPVIGHVKSVTLLYTIVTSSKGETVKIPNHTLFLEKIFNYTETTGAVTEFVIVFNIYGKENADFDKIKLFMGRLKHYTLRETKEWKSFSYSAFAMDTPNNTMEYRVNCTHREGWGFSQAVAAAKIEYYNTIRRLSDELGLYYIRASQPVSVATVVDADGEYHHNGVYGSVNSGMYSHELGSVSKENELRQRSNAVVVPAVSTQLNATPIGSPSNAASKKVV